MRGAARWAVLAGVTALVVALLWAAPATTRHEGVRAAPQNTIGTSGRAGVPEPEDSPGTLHDLETMTGAVDQHALVGSHVDFYATVADVADATSFWIGHKDNRVPVTAKTPVTAGQFVRITGMIEMNDQQVYIRASSVTAD